MLRSGEGRARSLALLQQAASAHQRGDATEARRLAKQILRKEPNHFDALHLLGIVEAQRGHHDKAAAWIGKALAINPGSAEAHANLGNVAREAQQFDAALASYDRALNLKPNYANALNSRGIVLQALGRFDDAVASFDRALAIEPRFSAAHNNRGMALMALRRLEEALASYDQAIRTDPGLADAHADRGKVLSALGRGEEAAAAFDHALKIQPHNARLHYDYGVALANMARLDDALASFDRALQIDPQFAAALNNRGTVLQQLGRLDEALASFDSALAIRPDDTVLANCSAVLAALGRLDDALACHERLSAARPDAERLNERGMMLERLKRHPEAAAAFQAALAADPEQKYTLGRLLYNKLHLCDWTGLAADIDRLGSRIRSERDVVEPFRLLALGHRADDQLACARILVADRYPAAKSPLWGRVRHRRERIRVAYVCGEFGAHPVSHLAAELFERHDRSRFEIVAISIGPNDQSPMRHRLEAVFDTFIDVRGRPDEGIAEVMHDSEIDIAVNLNGHTGFERTGVFALRPCPIQVNYLGFTGTMGADYVDYIIADRHVIPADQQSFYAEKVVYLPNCYQPVDSTNPYGERIPTRAEVGLAESGMVYCCFNNTYKITPDVFALWMRLLQQVEGSILWLRQASAEAERNLRREAENHGVRAERLLFAPRVPLADHFARHRAADLFLDTSPFNAHTTATDALWAGLPVLTRAGSTFAGRVGASLLAAAGLPELITSSPEDYEAMALRLAHDPSLLASLKAKLLRNRQTSPLFDTERYCRDLEAAYATMWNRHQRGEPPAGFPVQ